MGSAMKTQSREELLAAGGGGQPSVKSSLRNIWFQQVDTLEEETVHKGNTNTEI